MTRTARLVALACLSVAVTGVVIGLAAPALAGSVPDCKAAALRAMRADVTLTALPSGCRGLRPDQVTRAAVTAISEFAAHGRKVERRHLAATYGARVRYLINQVRPRHQAGPAVPPGTFGPPAAPRVPVALAALAAWLLTAATGGYLLAGWLAHGGMRGGRRPRTGLPPSVILTHFGLAVAGLTAWVGYLVSGAAPIAWLATGLLLPVVGLGMATLVLAIPEGGSGSAPSARMPVVVISVHGILATVTMLLVMLAAIASGR
jgi:hypothetical protein